MVKHLVFPLPSQLGICLEEDTTTLRIHSLGGVRHVAPYFITRTLNVGRYTEGDDESLLLLVKRIVKNRTLKDWWHKELVAGRLELSCYDGSSQNTTTTATLESKKIPKNAVLIGRYHFHEQSIVEPTTDDSWIVYEDHQYMVVNKPGGVDVLSNPDGHRVFQSLPGMIYHQTGSLIFPAHRIDNPVSGLVCCGKTKSDTKRLARRIQARESIKTYIARVQTTRRHDFLQDPSLLPYEIQSPLGYDKTVGKCTVDPIHGKASHTSIVAVLIPTVSNDGTSVIVVRPHTGRKHQIRMHLADIGLPIANDKLYNPLWNEKDALLAFGESIPFYQKFLVKDCPDCRYIQSLDASNPGPRLSQPIWLHSWKYEFPTLGHSFEAPPPEWARVEPWTRQRGLLLLLH